MPQSVRQSPERSAIERYLLSLDYDRRALLSVQEDGAMDALPGTTRSQEGGAVIITTKKQHSLTKNLSEVAILRPTAGVIFPGALVHADRDLMEGQPTAIGLPRGPVTLSIDLPGMPDSSMKVADPANSTVQDAIAGILNKWNRSAASKGYVNAARSYLEVRSIFSSQQVALELGFSAKWTSGSASAQLSASSDTQTSSVLAYFKQVFYTVTMDTPKGPADVFGDSVALKDVTEIMNAERPPAYVRSVDYGRILMIKMETKSRELQMDLQGALRQVTSGVELEGQVKAKYSEIVKNSTFTVVAVGGDSREAAKFTGTEEDLKQLKSYIESGATYRPDNPGSPVAYTVTFLKDNKAAAMKFTTDYTETESVEHLNRFIKLVHSGAYVAKFTVTWEEADAKGNYVGKSWESGEKTAGYSNQVDLPGDARNVKILGEAETGHVWDPWGEALNVTLAVPDNGSYRISGTTLNRRGEKETE